MSFVHKMGIEIIFFQMELLKFGVMMKVKWKKEQNKFEHFFNKYVLFEFHGFIFHKSYLKINLSLNIYVHLDAQIPMLLMPIINEYIIFVSEFWKNLLATKIAMCPLSKQPICCFYSWFNSSKTCLFIWSGDNVNNLI